MTRPSLEPPPTDVMMKSEEGGDSTKEGQSGSRASKRAGRIERLKAELSKCQKKIAELTKALEEEKHGDQSPRRRARSMSSRKSWTSGPE